MEPHELPMIWVRTLIQELRLAFITNQTSVELGQPFNVVYRNDRWYEALEQAKRVCIKEEQYEYCAEIKEMQDKISTNHTQLVK